MPGIAAIFLLVIGILVLLPVVGLGFFLVVLLIRALLKYLRSGEVRRKKIRCLGVLTFFKQARGEVE